MLRNTVIFILIASFVASPGPLLAGALLSLPALLEEARQNNPDIRAARKRWEAAQARVPAARSLDNPSVGLTFEKIPRGTLKLNKVEADDRMLTLTQMLPFFGKLSLKGKIAVVEAQMAASEFKAQELAVINAVKNAYFDLFLNDKERELNRASRDLLLGIIGTAEARYAVGEMSQEELLKLNFEIARLNNTIVNLAAERKAKETRLNTLLNREPELPLAGPELAEDADFSVEVAALYKAALVNQPELLTFAYAIDKNRFAKSLAKRNFFPDLMAGLVQHGITAGAIGPWDLMLSLSVPFWFWTKQRYELKEAIINIEEAEAAYAAMKNRVLAETRELATRVEIARNKIDLYKNNLLPLLQGSIDSSLSGYRSGAADIMMLLDGERMLIETKMNYYQALVEYNMGLADLERAVGQDLSEVEK